MRLPLLTLPSALLLLACEPGFELDLDFDDPLDEESIDRTFRGSTSDASWILSLDDESNTFQLANFSNPGDDDEGEEENYLVTGTYSTNNDLFELNISTNDINPEIRSDEIQGIELGDHGILLAPFSELHDEWVPLVLTSECPTNNLAGLAILLEQDADPQSDAISWISNFQYDVSNETLRYPQGIALDPAYTVVGNFNEASINCTNGYVERSAGDRYLGTSATIAELMDRNGARAFSLPSDQLDNVSDLTSDEYFGFVRDDGDVNNAFNVEARCEEGICSITNTSDQILYELEIVDLNYEDIDGLTTAIINDPDGVAESTPALCITNEDIGNDSDVHQHLLLCTAQSLVDNAEVLQIFISAEEDI